VRHDHDEEREDVQQKAQEQMNSFLAALHRVPAIPVQIERRSLQQKERTVNQERRKEDVRQIVHELGIQSDQQEEEDSAEQPGGRVGGGQQFRKFLGQLVVAGVLGPHTHDLADPGENRNT